MKGIFVFDFDGVIADSLHVVVPAYNKIASSFDLNPVASKEEFTELFNGNLYDGLQEWGLTEERLESFLQELSDRILDNIEDIPLFDHMDRILERLTHQGHEVLIITSNTSRIINRFLQYYGVKEIKEVLGVEYGRSKVEKINKVKQRYSEETIYYIGDTVGDIVEGKKAGVKTVVVTWGFHARNKLEENTPDHILDEPEELLHLGESGS